MKTNYEKYLIGMAGELEVSKMMSLKGWIPSLSSKNCPSFDIFGFNPETSTSTVIQVKTTKDKKGSKKTSFQLSIPHDKREEYLNRIVCPYIFVHIDDYDSFTFFILTKNELKQIIIETDDKYYNRDRTNPINPSYPIAVSLNDLKPFKDKWDSIWSSD